VGWRIVRTRQPLLAIEVDAPVAAKGELDAGDLAGQFKELMGSAPFIEALAAFLPPDQASQQRLPDLLAMLRAITAIAER
jgi:hypothetical protein